VRDPGSATIVDRLDPLEDREPGIVARREALAIHEFALEGREEALARFDG
jgi:hypothetical protein